jgi:hypothetical protein
MYRPLDKFTSGGTKFSFDFSHIDSIRMNKIENEIKTLKNIIEIKNIRRHECIDELIDLYRSNASHKKRFDKNRELELLDEEIKINNEELKKLLKKKKRLTYP